MLVINNSKRISVVNGIDHKYETEAIATELNKFAELYALKPNRERSRARGSLLISLARSAPLALSLIHI